MVELCARILQIIHSASEDYGEIFANYAEIMCAISFHLYYIILVFKNQNPARLINTSESARCASSNTSYVCNVRQNVFHRRDKLCGTYLFMCGYVEYCPLRAELVCFA